MTDGEEKRDCLLNGCPNVDHCKEVLGGRITLMGKIAIGLLAFIAGSAVTFSIWAADKKDVQEEKVTRLEAKVAEYGGHWDEQHVVNKALLETMDGLKEYMIEQKTIQKILHPELNTGD